MNSKQKTAGPRKSDLKRSGYRSDRDHEESSRYSKNRYYVGGRELDRRSRVHRERSRSRERRHGKSDRRRSRSRSRDRHTSSSSRRRSSSRDRRDRR